jgi:hypothetical protein
MLDRYDEIRPLMRTGDAILWHSDTLLGSLIQWVSRSRYNHVSLVLCLGLADAPNRPQDRRSPPIDITPPKGYSDVQTRRFVVEALEPGIVVRQLRERLSRHKGRVWWFPLLDEFNLYRTGIGSWALDHLTPGYDIAGLLENIAGRVPPNTNRFFCSEFWYLSLLGAGIPLKTLGPDLKGKAPRPSDVAEYKVLGPPVLIYES